MPSILETSVTEISSRSGVNRRRMDAAFPRVLKF
jgi:hypothetical protein